MIKRQIKKLVLILTLSISLLLITTQTALAAECYFKTYSDDCPRFQNPYKTFTLTDLSSNVHFSHYEVDIYNNKNPENKIQYELDNNKITLTKAFSDPGVYTIKVSAYDKAGTPKTKEFNYIFDTLNPMPPIIPVELKTTSSSITIEGEAMPNSVVYAQKGTQKTSTNVDENGDFSLEITSLQTGINYVRFYTRYQQGTQYLDSQYIERVIVNGDITADSSPQVTSINLHSLDDSNYNYDTTPSQTYKQNFYVQGTLTGTKISGAVVYINGNPTIADNQGKFGGFTLLNEGDNQIVVRSGTQTSSYNIEYIVPEFYFTKFDTDKVVSMPTASILGETSKDESFEIYLNGEYKATQVSSSQKFSTSISGLVAGKNFLELRSGTNDKISEIIYYDTKSPTAELASSLQFSTPSELVFKITDDIGINVKSIELNLGSQTLKNEQLKVRGNYYIFDISSQSDGNHAFTLKGTDLAGKTFQLSNTVTINQDATTIQDITTTQGDIIGNNIFLQTQEAELNLYPSQNVAFKKITLDGVDQIDYEISFDNTITLNIEPTDKQGVLYLEFVNSQGQTSSATYNYFSDEENPEIELDYITNPFSIDKAKISGEITDSNFDWSSLTINNQKSFTRYGNYFEALIDISSENLRISGYDYAKNVLDQTYGSIFFYDTEESEVKLSDQLDDFQAGLEGSVYNNNEAEGVYNLVKNYDGLDLLRAYISADGFKFPSQQRYGYRAVNLQGKETSDKEIYSIQAFQVKAPQTFYSTAVNAPEIYFNGNDKKSKSEESFVQGNIISASSITSVKAGGKSCTFDDNSFVCPYETKTGENEVKVTVKDSKGKTTTKSFSQDIINTQWSIEITEISGDSVYNSNGELYLMGSEITIKGTVETDAVLNLLINGKTIIQETDAGEFTITVDLSDEIDGVDEKEIIIQIEAVDEHNTNQFSEQKTLTYKRIFDAFASVSVR